MQEIQNKQMMPKDAIIVFSSFTFVCLAAIFILIVRDILTIEHFLSFANRIQIVSIALIASIFLLLFGIILTMYTPEKYIDVTNKMYHKYSFFTLFAFMGLSAMFEELFFRGIVQNVLLIAFKSDWLAIALTTLLFVASHIQYFKKPLMLTNITIPSIIFGWIYFQTNNILVPIVVHFILNIGMTLLFKYDLIRMKKS